MSKEVPIIPLFEARVSVDPTGCVSRLYKIPVKFTGTNYIPQRVTTELEAQGYDHAFGMTGRIKATDLMKVRHIGSSPKHDNVSIEIHYLEGKEDEAKVLLRGTLDELMTKIKDNAVAMHEAWTTRKERPRRK